jgi:uncharacterized sulfatase
MKSKTKIILIMTDTQGTNVIGCYGRPDMRTPNIDRLAREGLRFDHAYTTSPICGPARSGLFTGTYPHTNGSWTNDVPLGENIKTIGQRFMDNGLHSGYIGKWHLDGTDYYGNGRCPDGWDPEYWYDGRCYLEELSVEERMLVSGGGKSPEYVHENNIDERLLYGHRVSDRAIRFLEEHGTEDFFLTVSYDEPHGPCLCPPPFCDMFTDYEYPLGDNARDSLEEKPEHQKEWAEDIGCPTDGTTMNNPMYFGCNSYADYELGRVIDAIDAYASDALVILTSDHGDHLYSHRLIGKGPTMYEETTNIPLIVRWPDEVGENTVCANPVSHIDLVPTLLDIAGLKVPAFLEGRSMLEAFTNPHKQRNEHVFIEFHRMDTKHDYAGFQPIRCVLDKKHKLVINLNYTDELYDLEKDPGEIENLIDDNEYRNIRNHLHDALLEWMNDTRDPFRRPIWERRAWRRERKLTWGGPVRFRRDDGYQPRVLSERTGLEIEGYLDSGMG